jgi:hypothetical protein
MPGLPGTARATGNWGSLDATRGDGEGDAFAAAPVWLARDVCAEVDRPKACLAIRSCGVEVGVAAATGRPGFATSEFVAVVFGGLAAMARWTIRTGAVTAW